MTGSPEWECNGSDEAALNGIYDALQRLRDTGDQYVSSQCEEVIAICCGRLASIYGIKSVDVIRWLYNPQHDLAPKSFTAFVKERGLSEAFKLHYSKQTLQCLKEVDPHDTIIVNVPKSPISPEELENSEVAGSQELAVRERTCRPIAGQRDVVSEDIFPNGFDALDETYIPEHDIHSKSRMNGTTLLPTSDFDARLSSSPNPQVLAQEGCSTDLGPKLICNARGPKDGGPARLDTNQEPKTGGLAKTLQSYETFLALAPKLYSLSYEADASSRQLPPIRHSETGCLELLQRTSHNVQGYHGYSTDYSNRPMSTLLPSHRFDDQKLSDTGKLEDWALVSRGVRKCPYGQSPPPLIELSPLKNSQNKSRMLGQLSLPVLWHRTPFTNASAQQSTVASTSHHSTRPATAEISTVKKQPSGAKGVSAEAKTSKVISTLNRLAEQGWPQLLPEELVAKLALMNSHCTKSWMASFGQHIASYQPGELYQCPFGDGRYRGSSLFLRHLVDEHSGSKVLKSYDADNQLTLVSRLKAQC